MQSHLSLNLVICNSAQSNYIHVCNLYVVLSLIQWKNKFRKRAQILSKFELKFKASSSHLLSGEEQWPSLLSPVWGQGLVTCSYKKQNICTGKLQKLPQFCANVEIDKSFKKYPLYPKYKQHLILFMYFSLKLNLWS